MDITAIRTLLFTFLTTAAACCCASLVSAEDVPPVLSRYVNADDGAFKWGAAEEMKPPLPGAKLTLLEVTSQKWHDDTWKHCMIVAVPNNVSFTDHALMYITLGRTGQKPSKASDMLTAAAMARQAQMPICILYQVPNQPLDPRKTAKNGGDWTEDHLVAESILKALETKDPTWVVLLPMTKSVIKAMDAAQQFLKKQYEFDVDSFIVGGASKRGWTSWLVGAVKDPRVVGLMPIIYNNLNMPAQMNGQIQTWGHFSPRIAEYTDRKVFEKGEVPADFKLQAMKIIDPYYYLDRITIPKMLIHGANDPYWLVDATKHYWNDIQGPKFLVTVPDVGHQDMDKPENLMKVLPSVGVFCRYVASGGDWPRLEWDMKDQGKEWKISIQTEIPDTKKILWTAYCDDNNFVKEKPERVKWQSKEVGTGDVITVLKPEKGHIAFFIELQSIMERQKFRLTTEVWRF
ncbi:MAG: PhoPQ-activated pathogenicity-related family protein [Planctomycetaceae bacterium]|jgi:PhoPQ-activated pathogenicity-related protein|nr:PhoPQ-activated pathogenicity-related family protein [Planctomycetaceae bacterium]